MFYRLSLFAASMALSTICASAQTPKEVRILVGYASGGGYDTYSRVVAQHLGKHLRGAPAVIVQNMPGADGLTVANYMFTGPAKD